MNKRLNLLILIQYKSTKFCRFTPQVKNSKMNKSENDICIVPGTI